jgi:hypothetical protein
MNKKIIFFYLLLLLFHVAHVMEEAWGRFWLMNEIFGLGWFLVINWFLFSIPVFIFYFLLQNKKPAVYLALIYAVIMVINGLGHNIMTLATGKYFGGYAGGFTGIFLILTGVPLAYMLWGIRKNL